jgi:hypothetical protein
MNDNNVDDDYNTACLTGQLKHAVNSPSAGDTDQYTYLRY